MINDAHVENLYATILEMMEASSCDLDCKRLNKLINALDAQGMTNETKVYELASALLQWLQGHQGTVITVATTENKVTIHGPFGSLAKANKWCAEKWATNPSTNYRSDTLRLP